MQIKNDPAAGPSVPAAWRRSADASVRGRDCLLTYPHKTTCSTPSYLPLGGRVASDQLRHAERLCDDFAGLEEGADRYGLLLLVKKVGKLAGFTPRMLQLLDYYLAFTRDCDWEEGSRPIVFQSLSRTALDLGVSERQVQKLEAALFAAGAITWHDSGNHRRYGQRCVETGRLLYAFGVDLTPLAYLRGELEERLAEKQLYDEAWMATKRGISHHRRQLRALLSEFAVGDDTEDLAAWQQRYDEIAVQIRTHMDLAQLRSLLDRHSDLLSELLAAMGVEEGGVAPSSQRAPVSEKTSKGSSTSERTFIHYKSTTQPFTDSGSRGDAGFQESVADDPVTEDAVLSAGLQHVTLAMAVGAASARLAGELPSEPNWSDVVAAAYRLKTPLGVSQASWSEACGLLGRTGAALCLLVTDRALDREENMVRQPAAYFRGMVDRGRRGELRLHSSLFGLLEQG